MKLTNQMVSEQYKNIQFFLMPSDFKGALAYYIAVQNPNAILENNEALIAYMDFLYFVHFKNPKEPIKFTCEKLRNIVNEDIFCAIPEVRDLNEMRPDFIDLGALARNVYYMIIKQVIIEDNLADPLML
jgi:hypothetical protein